jgi:hypothetical protein
MRDRIHNEGNEMNLLHLKYVISIAENGSINKAAEELHVAQPNLSRVVREMEADLGIRFFHRSSKGMMLTPDGELFVNQARKILEQIDEMESLYKEKKTGKQRFSISVPRASYISDAFAAFSKMLGKEKMEIFYQETNALQAVKNILEVGYNLGIIRYAAGYDKYFKQMMASKDSGARPFQKAFRKIVDAYKTYDVVYIGCYCHLNESCHGDFIIDQVIKTAVRECLLEKAKEKKESLS